MLKGNLATRPFYNDRLVSLTIGIIAIAVVALTAFNATQLFSLSKQRQAVTKEVKANEAETAKLRQEAQRLVGAVDASGMRQLSGSVNEANFLIDRRTFSWTAFLSTIEHALPMGVRVVEVAPKPEKNVMHMEMIVVFKTPEDLPALVDAMEKSGMFKEVVPSSQNPNDDGTETALIQSIYLAPMGEAPVPNKTGRKGHP